MTGGIQFHMPPQTVTTAGFTDPVLYEYPGRIPVFRSGGCTPGVFPGEIEADLNRLRGGILTG